MKDLETLFKTNTDISKSEYISFLKSIIFKMTEYRIPSDYLNILKNSQDIKIRFSAFYCLFTHYRRFEKDQELYDLVENYIDQFKDKEYKYLYEIVYSQYYKFKFLNSTNKKMYKQAIKHGLNAVKEFDINCSSLGCFNNFAEIVLDGCKYDNIVESKDISISLEYINRAIDIQENKRNNSPYSRYYCTKARLLLIQGHYEDAKNLILKAISYEKADEKDSLIRIAYYHNVSLDIKTSESLKKVDFSYKESNKKYNEIKNELDHQQIKFIEILGFFAAVIALITGSISITLNTSDFIAAFGLIVSLSGCLSISYTVLKILFSSRVLWIRFSVAIFISTSLLVIGFLIGKGII